tara:strand:- start:55 stop:405 length:351 start_codon:yes stop_codon:yes gene_type:complete
MSNLSKDLILDGYWVNKKSGTIHWVSESKAVSGGKKLWTQTTNLRYNRDYFFYDKKSMVSRGYGSLDNFLKNYEFICDSADVPHDFYHYVLHNNILKENFKYGKLSKEEFFGRVFN